ncbi:hypothetical protein ES708_28266 [subsurface metagenome]
MTLETEVKTEGLLNQLADELVTSYTAENKTPTQIVTDLLAFQVLTPAVTVGTIDPTVTRTISVVGDTILRAIYRLRDTIGGYIYIDNDRALQWRTSIGEDKGQQIRYRKNLKGITREIDYVTLANRIYAYGAGEGDARIKLSDAEGQEEDYVEDTDSQQAYPDGWGGIYVKEIVDKSITHPDTLLAWATLKLAELKDPRITYKIDTVDLSASDEIDFRFEALKIGSTIKVIDEDLGIDVSAQVVKIRHPDLLLHLEKMQIEVANRVRDITDALTEVYDVQQLAQHVATEIGAGQVIVKGAFTVQDWVTEGETTIVGSHIETGTITALQLFAGEIITGTAQIKDGIITNAKIDTLAAGKITGQVIDAQIANIAFAKITNVEVTSAQIVSLVAGKITGYILDAQIASIEFAKITNVWVTSAQIQSLAAGKISAGTITGVIFSQAAGGVVIDGSGITISGDVLFLKSGASVGHIYQLGTTLYINSPGDIILQSIGAVRPFSTGVKDLGNVSYHWAKLWADKIYRVVQDSTTSNTMHIILPTSIRISA